MADSCISLSGSTACPAFNASSISTAVLPGQFSFLSNVTDTASFDTGLSHFVGTQYVVDKYQDLFSCTKINPANTTDLYARYTFSFICNAIIQNSISACGLSPASSRPLCADSCAEFALSEQSIVSSPDLCASRGGIISQLRADFTNCALPADSISGICIPASLNEPDNCGYQSNLEGLCAYCSTSTVNATDSCCETSDTQSRCSNVHLPAVTSMAPLFTTGGPAPSGTLSPGHGASGAAGLTGGQIAGIVIGSIVGAILLLALLICCCIFMRRRRQDQGSSLNQPTPPRSGGTMTQVRPPPFEALPGARVTRMTALEGATHDGGHGDSSGFDTSPESQNNNNNNNNNNNDDNDNNVGMAVAGAVPARKKFEEQRQYDGSSPESAAYSSPEGTGQSERMSSFKDYYSQDEIRSGDYVSTLWAYQPRAPDEFELERGDMVKVVGIWDDGWATGVRSSQRADEWSPTRRNGRDSVVSNESALGESSQGDIRAFPLVCVCLPQHWRRTIEGETSSSPPPSD